MAVQAEQLWAETRKAAHAMSGRGLNWIRIDLGTTVPVDVLAELARLAGASLQVYRISRWDTQEEIVCELLIREGEVDIIGASHRLATPADAKIPRRGSRV